MKFLKMLSFALLIKSSAFCYTIGIIGDSIGTSLNGQLKPWPEILQERMIKEQNDIYIINDSIGATRFYDAHDRSKSMANLKPDLVIFCLGTNDAHSLVDKDDFKEKLDQNIKILQKSGCKVWLAKIDYTYFPLMKGFKDKAKEYEKIQFEVSIKRKVLLIPYLQAPMLSNDNLMLDAVHPNQEGLEGIANVIFYFITKIALPK
jgi:lysophospholipase L1-like esterase